MDAELIETLNENLEVTGVMPRSEVHEKGLLHAVVQLYIYQKKGKKFMLYLQQRSNKKYSYNLCRLCYAMTAHYFNYSFLKAVACFFKLSFNTQTATLFAPDKLLYWKILWALPIPASL